MKQYSKILEQDTNNSARVMETGNHFKNGASPKSQMNMKNFKAINKRAKNMETLTLNSTKRNFFRNFITVCFIAVICFFSACTTKTPDENGLIGIWKHPITSNAQISVNGKNVSNGPSIVSYEILRLKADKTFTFGEYGANHGDAFYEAHGKWQLSDNKDKLEFTYEDGERGSIDIRKYDGKSFITTSREGNDFKFDKE
jgi:hypothetical protein